MSVIPEAAVEAAARARYADEGLSWDEGMVPDWACEDDSLQDSYRAAARAALEAAAPFMLAEVQERLADAYDEGLEAGEGRRPRGNPYI